MSCKSRRVDPEVHGYSHSSGRDYLCLPAKGGTKAGTKGSGNMEPIDRGGEKTLPNQWSG